jgi:hypothetical protein
VACCRWITSRRSPARSDSYACADLLSGAGALSGAAYATESQRQHILARTRAGNRAPNSVSPNYVASASVRFRPIGHDTGTKEALRGDKSAYALRQRALAPISHV